MPLYEDPGEHTYASLDKDIVDQEIMYRYTWDKAFMVNNAIKPALKAAIDDPEIYHSIEIWGRNSDADGFDQFLVAAFDMPVTDVPEGPEPVEPVLLSDTDAVNGWLSSYDVEMCNTYSVFVANGVEDGFSYSVLLGEENEDRCILVNNEDIRDRDNLMGCVMHCFRNLSPYFDHLMVYKVDISPDPDDLDPDDADVVFFSDPLGRKLGARGQLVKHFVMDVDLSESDGEEGDEME